MITWQTINNDYLVGMYYIYNGREKNFIRKEGEDVKMQSLGKSQPRSKTSIPQPCLVRLGGLSRGLQTKKSLVRFPFSELAWAAGQVPQLGVCERHPTDVSLTL